MQVDLGGLDASMAEQLLQHAQIDVGALGQDVTEGSDLARVDHHGGAGRPGEATPRQAVHRRAEVVVADGERRRPCRGRHHHGEQLADDGVLSGFEPPPPGHKDWLAVSLPGVQDRS